MNVQQAWEQAKAIVEPLKPTIDVVSVGTTAAAIMQWIPPATAILTFIWVGLRIYETKTVQSLIRKHRKNHKK